MKIRLISLVLCVLMISFAILVGCSSKDDEFDINPEETAPRTPVSLNFWIITDKKTTPDAQTAVEKAFNDIVKSRFTTYVDLVFLTEDEYKTALANKMEEIDEQKKLEEEEAKRRREEERSKRAAGITDAKTSAPDTTEYVEETVTNAYGLPELKYPNLSDYQIDIILIKGIDMLNDLVKANRLNPLDKYLTAESKQLTKYIHPIFMDMCKINKVTYAIPNNQVIGEYTYLLINKELADKYYYDPDSFSRLDDETTKKFIEEIAEKEKDYTPVLSRVDSPFIHYWSDDGSRSLLASYFSATASQGIRGIMRNPFAISQFTSHELQMQEYEDKGYFSKNPETDDKFAVALMKGDASLPDAYSDDYYVKVVKKPVATEETVFESMLGVTTYTKNLDRAMEIITLLNTDPELRNLLQYGIKGTHYDIDETGALRRLNDHYMMNLVDTGNVFMAYPEEGMPLDAWEYGKKQNLDAIVSPLLGLGTVWEEVDKEIMEKIDALSEQYFARMDACTNATELSEFFTTAVAELEENEDFKTAISMDSEIASPHSVYFNKWYNVLWPPTD
ncbi:MAG: hypothetical protein GX303_00990 [Clostridiales bacterium]|nr:hypothetical protein [Clostridiales bacterium]